MVNQRQHMYNCIWLVQTISQSSKCQKSSPVVCLNVPRRSPVRFKFSGPSNQTMAGNMAIELILAHGALPSVTQKVSLLFSVLQVYSRSNLTGKLNLLWAEFSYPAESNQLLIESSVYRIFLPHKVQPTIDWRVTSPLQVNKGT